ncbi:hypothetical protein FE783_22380 [Paenibacillus mesophilus]|uniref:hypothetical protein n=1 Tax=Paenibacillus mesophilus TaxID=2582849 RepID=UPI00110F4E1A|nr:hypothetical protein [Paenibacillus mesophilus]TMV47350.1 hypothetical protein FE783_22380 [Paenibacillus mesophilus]
MKSLLARIWKYKLHYMLVIPALLLIFVFKIIPFVIALILPFKRYILTKGIWDSPWVGMNNFIHLFGDPSFRNVIANTLLIKLGYIAASGATALVVALALSCVASGKLRTAFATLFLVPYFVPTLIFAYIATIVFTPSHSPLLDIQALVWIDIRYFRILLVMVELLKTCGIPILIALAAINSKHAASVRDGMDDRTSDHRFITMNVFPAVRAISAFMLLQLSALLSTDFELVSSLYSPLVYEVGDTISTYMVRTGLMNLEISRAGAVWLIQFAVQLLLAILAYLVVRGRFLADLFSGSRQTNAIRTTHGGKGLAGIGVAVLYALVVSVPLYMLFVYPFTNPSSAGHSLSKLLSESNFLLYTGINLAAVIINMLMTVTLAYPLTVKDLPGRSLYKAFLLLVLTMGSGAMHEYLMVKSLGMVNTFFPHLFYGFFSVIPVIVLKSIFNSKYADLKAKESAEGRGELRTFFMLFIPKIWKPLLALGVLQFASLWNSYYMSLVYLARKEMYPPIMLFLSTALSGGKTGIPYGDPVLLQYAAVVALPPLLLLLLFRRWLTSEVLLSQIQKL